MSARTVVVVMIGIAAVGAADAANDADWDLVVLFGAIATLAVGLLVASAGGRRPTSVRADLHRWIVERAATTGEQPRHVVDRALAAYRDGLVGGETDDAAAR